jgi:hypothetical protein
MSTPNFEEEEERSIRANNRVLRISNRKIREREREERERADALYYALLEADGSRDAAIEAFGKLWGSGEFDCGPEDVELIVEECLTAVRMLKAARTQPAAQVSCEPNEA